MTEIAFRWFILCYLTLGITLITLGVYLLTRTEEIENYLLLQAKQPDPPFVFIQVLKFLFVFSLVCLFFSFFPFTWIEFLFSVWLVIILFTISQFLVHWKETSRILLIRVDELSGKIRFTAANMVSLGIIMFLLYYQLVV
ncbi:MAG TPA: hypothetical protein VKM36_05820 [Balneolaceae bacterium]|nr:hypothetical protein [Balneolaceae bacterium]